MTRDNTAERPLTRRQLLTAGAVAAGATELGLVGGVKQYLEADSLGVGTDLSVLAIGPGESYTIDSTERYRAVNWADGGEATLDGELVLDE